MARVPRQFSEIWKPKRRFPTEKYVSGPRNDTRSTPLTTSASCTDAPNATTLSNAPTNAATKRKPSFFRGTARTAYAINVAATNFVYLMTDLSDSQCTLMIDCGSDISIIKANKVNLNRTVFPNDTCNITGIGHTSEKTIASTYSNILIDGNKLPQKLHIVKNDFPIPTDGILGRDFFTAYKCQINYDSWNSKRLPAHCR